VKTLMLLTLFVEQARRPGARGNRVRNPCFEQICA